MLHEISTCIWFDQKSKEAFEFYKTVFGEVELISENPFVVNYTLFGRRFMHLNGGPGFPVNPSISFFVNLDSEASIEKAWEALSTSGKILMPLQTYPWSKKYGWCQDVYGVNWQLMLGHEASYKVMPSMMFTQQNNGKAAEAISFYTSIFPNSPIIAMSKYEKGEHDIEGHLKYSQFHLNHLPFGAMDSSMQPGFSFNEGISFIISVDTQDEIDFYWEKLQEDGGTPGRCGWLKDRYGVSWQVVPTLLGKLMSNPETAPKATYAFMQMSKFIIADLEKAVS